MLSPDCEEWASSTMTAKRLPGSSPISLAITGNFCRVVTMIVLPSSRAALSWREVVSMFSTTPRVCSNWRMRRLELPVEQAPVRDDDDGIEDALVLVVVERRELVGEPGDGEALPASGRVLDQISLAGALRAGVGDEGADGSRAAGSAGRG